MGAFLLLVDVLPREGVAVDDLAAAGFVWVDDWIFQDVLKAEVAPEALHDAVVVFADGKPGDFFSEEHAPLGLPEAFLEECPYVVVVPFGKILEFFGALGVGRADFPLGWVVVMSQDGLF